MPVFDNKRNTIDIINLVLLSLQAIRTSLHQEYSVSKLTAQNIKWPIAAYSKYYTVIYTYGITNI